MVDTLLFTFFKFSGWVVGEGGGGVSTFCPKMPRSPFIVMLFFQYLLSTIRGISKLCAVYFSTHHSLFYYSSTGISDKNAPKERIRNRGYEISSNFWGPS